MIILEKEADSVDTEAKGVDYSVTIKTGSPSELLTLSSYISSQLFLSQKIEKSHIILHSLEDNEKYSNLESYEFYSYISLPNPIHIDTAKPYKICFKFFHDYLLYTFIIDNSGQITHLNS